MQATLKLISLVALIVTILPSVLLFFGLLTMDTMKWLALTGTLIWFLSTPWWMGRTIQET